MTKVYSEVYGCTANSADSEIMAGLLSNGGFKIVNKLEDADLIILNTCCVKNPTASRMVFRIKEFTKTGKPLVVAGCFAKAERDAVERLNPAASLVGPDAIDKIVDVARSAMEGKKSVVLDGMAEKPGLPHVRSNPIIEIIEINSGCCSQCTFCQTKLARGDLRSYRPENIRDQVRKAVSEGCNEIWLTSQDTLAYGKDIGIGLSDLLGSVTRIEGKFMIRVGMMNPLHLGKVEIEGLIEAYENDRVFKFLHMCVQSGSDKVLKDMERGYKVEDFVEYVRMFRKEIPELTLETDIIVGFPTESSVDFEKTVGLVKEIRPDVVNISKYGARPGTVAAKMGQLDPKVISERSGIMHDIMAKIKKESNRKWLGWEGEVLIDEEGVKSGVWMGRNSSYKPILVESSNDLLGRFAKVRISAVESNRLLGIVI